jgi:CheY-like chemotaxis protein
MRIRNILLIDDDEDDQEIFTSAVAEISDTVTCDCIPDATRALATLTAKKELPDVIFLDLNMPIMNGQQFLSAIKKEKQLSAIPVIIFSTASDRATIETTRMLGAHDFITKPRSFDRLVEILAPLFQ